MKGKEFYSLKVKPWLTWEKWLFLLLAVIAVLILEVTDIGCPILYLTGVSCPGCGLTRAYFCLLSGDIPGAFYFHPLWWGIPIGVILLFASECSGRFQGLARPGLLVLLFLWLVVYMVRMIDVHDSIVFFTPGHGILPRVFMDIF